MEVNKIYNQDCLIGLSNIPDKSINLVVIDPPYNIKKAKWDTWKTVAEYVEFIDDQQFWQNHKLYLADLLDTSGSIVRHDSEKLARLIREIISLQDS